MEFYGKRFFDLLEALHGVVGTTPV